MIRINGSQYDMVRSCFGKAFDEYVGKLKNHYESCGGLVQLGYGPHGKLRKEFLDYATEAYINAIPSSHPCANKLPALAYLINGSNVEPYWGDFLQVNQTWKQSRVRVLFEADYRIAAKYVRDQIWHATERSLSSGRMPDSATTTYQLQRVGNLLMSRLFLAILEDLQQGLIKIVPMNPNHLVGYEIRKDDGTDYTSTQYQLHDEGVRYRVVSPDDEFLARKEQWRVYTCDALSECFLELAHANSRVAILKRLKSVIV